MFQIVLYQPEIPPNTGNIIRLCANVGSSLHLIQPLGFQLEDRRLRRAGLDYHEWVEVRVHESLTTYVESELPKRLFALSTRGAIPYVEMDYQLGDAFLFGPETRGLPQAVLDQFHPTRQLRIPMRPNQRSLNLSNAVAIILFDAWRKQGFAGAQ